ncbi:hypothetical protein [Streptococcus sp. X13SY08]|uniref:hypothetical protein n=1 Tax=unclassified Streptococcus TaxID=2608887 RepID=UPI002E7FF841|nr:hypothetical protein [Streptococcus sp. X13SY08]
MATDSAYAMESDYLSINPNNYLLIIWDKINYLIFHHNTVLALGLWNIFFIDTSILFIFMATKDYLSKKIADTSFFLLVLILGFSPQHIYTYSDPIALFFLSLTIFLFIKALKNNLAPVYLAGAGFIYAIAFGLRPTVLIFGIAGLIVFVHHLIQKNIYHSMKRIVTGALAFCLVFLAMNQAISYSLHHQNFAKYEEGKSRTLFYFVDLGLTFVGNNHAELPADVLSATGEDRNEEAIEDIKSRMAAYSYKDFVGHLFYKYYWITNEGMFGWFQERVLNEASPLDSAWLMNFQQWTISKLVRTYVYVEGENYNYYARAIQMVWILISFGIAFYPFFYREKFYPLWMQITVFGALLFLMIFEGGRTRYLIQFLPAIITVSACGLVAVHDRMTLHKKGDS